MGIAPEIDDTCSGDFLAVSDAPDAHINTNANVILLIALLVSFDRLGHQMSISLMYFTCN